MSTRAYIGIQNENGKIDAVYSHFDNYPEFTGKILFEHINTMEMVKELISMGAISSLADNIFYTRDHGEDLDIRHFHSINEFLNKCQEDYTYIFMDGKWFYRNMTNQLEELTDECFEDD